MQPSTGDRPSPPTVRRRRADAQANRDRLMQAGKAVFGERGADASLEEIARRAGVGIGTLYRHFATRDEMIAAIYRNEAEQMHAAAVDLAERLPPIEAVREWLVLFLDYVTAKRLILPMVEALPGGAEAVSGGPGGLVAQAATLLVVRAIEAGAFRSDLDPLDLVRALYGYLGVHTGEGWQTGARRLIDVLVDGARTAPS